jgi:hypothetical protein
LMAAEGRCQDVFLALRDHGWGVNDPALFGQTILPYVFRSTFPAQSADTSSTLTGVISCRTKD